MSRRLALPLAVLAWCALAGALLVTFVGPLAVPALGVSISRVSRLFVAVAVLGPAAAWCRGSITGLLDDLSASRMPYVATLLVVLVTFTALLLARGAVSVGGADSAGYLAQARRWATTSVHVPLPLSIPEVSDPWAQSTLGMRPDASGRVTVPTYPPGLPWLEAVALRTGGEAFAIRGLPLLAGLAALIAAWYLALPLAGPAGAAFVVTCLASLPTFLYQSLQPMSDVPALAAWLLALALARQPSRLATCAAACATVVAILIRPNLAPLVLPVAWQAALPADNRSRPVRPALVVCAAAAAAIAIVAAVQAYLYGSPLQSGYGRASELFDLHHIPENLRLYGAWIQEGIAWPARLALAAGTIGLVWRAARDRSWRPPAVMALTVVALYLVYIPFDSWTYLRFVLVPLAIAPLGVAYLFRLLKTSRYARWTFPVTMVVLAVVATTNLRLARELTVYGVRAREYRYEAAGRFVRDHLPGSVVVVAVQHSASAAYYSGRPVIRPDLLSPESFRAFLAWAAREHRPIAFVLDESEPTVLRARFGDVGPTALDWPPRAEIGRPVATRVWVDADRQTYLDGGRIRVLRYADAPR
jgi:hypothetical protein